MNPIRYPNRMPARDKELKITIPESLDYTGVFDDIFRRYTRRCELVSVRTTNNPLEAEADRLTQAARYERSEDRQGVSQRAL